MTGGGSGDQRCSRAVLIGVGDYAHPGLAPIPAAEANVTDIARLLTGAGGAFTPDTCHSVIDPAAGDEVGTVVARAAREATGVLLVYYTGHGLLDRRGRLHLALTGGDPDRIAWTTIPIATVREELLDSPALARVLILDCCFAGRAFEAMGDIPGLVAGQIDIRGTYTIASSSANETSFAPAGRRNTAFTAALLDAAGPEVTLDELYRRIEQDLQRGGYPRPTRRSVDVAGDLRLFGSQPIGDRPHSLAPRPFGRVFTVDTGHSVRSVAFAPDGQVLAAAGADGAVRLWNPIDQQQVGELPHAESVQSVAFSPNGQLLATTSKTGVVRLWDANTHREIGDFGSGNLPMAGMPVVFSPDGQLLATARVSVRLWDVDSRKQIGDPLFGLAAVGAVAFRPDGQLLAAGGQQLADGGRGVVSLWDPRTRHSVGSLTGHTGVVRAVAFGPDGQLLASGGEDNTTRLWDPNTHRQVGDPFPQPGPVWSVAFSPDGRSLATAGDHGVVLVWDLATGRRIGDDFFPHSGRVWSVAFSPDGRLLASGSEDGTVVAWAARVD